ncbi:craniofacial development protein 2-like [Culex quinquefasciatus]|uniref:craniofacial development protein 2-like n=1 Tax=Culex quinquefasciatus TaxID=7176 RepID=UPI0018E2CA47|nr:craniofacial development protein 2-like [Culex quinquefasciatus]
MYHPARAGLLARELHNLNVHVAAIQEVRWPGHGEREFTAVDPIANTSFKYHIYYSGGEKAMHGVGFVVIGDQKNRVIKWKVVNDRICVLRIKGKFFNYSLINIYAPTNDKPDDEKDAFYERLDKTYGECPRHDVKIVIGDANAQVGREVSCEEQRNESSAEKNGSTTKRYLPKRKHSTTRTISGGFMQLSTV